MAVVIEMESVLEQGLYPAGVETARVILPDEPSKSDPTMGSQPVRSGLAFVRMVPSGVVRNGETVFTLAAGYERWVFQISRDQTANGVANGAEYGAINLSKMMTVSTKDGQTAGVTPQGQTFVVTGMRAFSGVTWATPHDVTDVFLFGNMRHDAWLRNTTFGESIVQVLPRTVMQHGTVRWEWQVSDTKCQETIGALQDFDVPQFVSNIEAPVYQLRRDLVPGANHPNGKKLVLSWPDGMEFTVPTVLVPAAPVPDLIAAFRFQLWGYSVCGEMPGESGVCMPPQGVRVQQGGGNVPTEMFQQVMQQMQQQQAAQTAAIRQLSESLAAVRGLPAPNK